MTKCSSTNTNGQQQGVVTSSSTSSQVMMMMMMKRTKTLYTFDHGIFSHQSLGSTSAELF